MSTSLALAVNDLKVIYTELHPVKTKWYDIGLILDVPVETLEGIKTQNKDDIGACLREMLLCALKSTAIELTWKGITDALRNVVIGEGQLAVTLLNKYCPEDTMGSTSPQSALSEQFKEILLHLKRLKDIPEKMVVVKEAVSEFVSSSFQSGHSMKQVSDQMEKFYKEELLISKETFAEAQQMIKEEHARSGVEKTLTSANPCALVPLYSKDTIYHASICSHAVYSSNAGNYQQFFKNRDIVPGHNFTAVSMSRSKQDCFLIAQMGESTYYIAFKGLLLLSEWEKEYNSFNEGIMCQSQRFPIRYIIELLNKQCRVILTGFSFGGLLASTVAACVWETPFITSDHLKENMLCITFGQPLVSVEVVQRVVRNRPEIISTLHSIYLEDDHIPSLLSLLDECWSAKLQQALEQQSGVQLTLNVDLNTPFKDPSTEILLDYLGKLQQPEDKKKPLERQTDKLKEVLLCHHTSNQVRAVCQCSTVSVISCEEHTGLTWKENQTGITTTHLSQVQDMTNVSFDKHLVSDYTKSIFNAHLDKIPKYVLPETPQRGLGDVSDLKPSMSEVIIHHHGNQIAIALEGNNLWFCYQISFRGLKVPIHASNASNTSIQFNIPYESSPWRDNCKIVTLCSHFSSKPIKFEITVSEKRYGTTTRQEQLAKLSPSQVIELGYLCALLEKDHNSSEAYTLSYTTTFELIQRFLEDVVKVVPFESIAYAIANGNYKTAVQCTETLLSAGIEVPSFLMYNGLGAAISRFNTGFPVRLLKSAQTMTRGGVLTQKFCTTEKVDSAANTILVRSTSHYSNLFHESQIEDVTLDMKKFKSLKSPTNVGLAYQLMELQQRLNPRVDFKVSIIGGLAIETVYPIRNKSFSSLNSPLEILVKGRKKLADLANIYSECESCFLNQKMLESVNSIRHDELDTCTSLLGGFMDQEVVNIPLSGRSKDTIELSAPASVGVWTLFSLDYTHIKHILAKCRGEQLLVKVMNHVKSISRFDPDNVSVEYDPYAAKLQFMVQGMTKTVTCNTLHVSYSLERQLVELCTERKIDTATSLDELTGKWSFLFKENTLCLVTIRCRPLIARWLKWTLMIHNLREELAKYTAVGVVGLVNSGKSKLVSTLFGIEIPTGTTESKRTTVPFLYNLDKSVEGLNVVDFPGVDDEDDSIGELADLLLTIAQIIIFVVDYRKAHTQSAKKWLERLQVENVPVLVCLTFGDRLYAEHMTNKGEYPSKNFMTKIIKEQLSETQSKLRSTGSHQIWFFSFCQDNDSVLNTDPGRDKLKEVGIGTPLHVGEWLVKTFMNDFDQGELANRLEPFIHENIKKAALN